MEESKWKQIKLEPEYSESPAAEQHPRELLHPSIKREEENNRQTTLDEFF